MEGFYFCSVRAVKTIMVLASAIRESVSGWGGGSHSAEIVGCDLLVLHLYPADCTHTRTHRHRPGRVDDEAP